MDLRDGKLRRLGHLRNMKTLNLRRGKLRSGNDFGLNRGQRKLR